MLCFRIGCDTFCIPAGHRTPHGSNGWSFLLGKRRQLLR